MGMIDRNVGSCLIRHLGSICALDDSEEPKSLKPSSYSQNGKPAADGMYRKSNKQVQGIDKGIKEVLHGSAHHDRRGEAFTSLYPSVALRFGSG